MRACATSSIVASAVVYDSTPFGANLNQKCLFVARVAEEPYIDIYILTRVQKNARLNTSVDVRARAARGRREQARCGATEWWDRKSTFEFDPKQSSVIMIGGFGFGIPKVANDG
jgi:hypothetical protein